MLEETFERMKYSITIDKTEYSIKLNSRIKRGTLLRLLEATKNKLKGFSVLEFLKKDKISLPPSLAKPLWLKLDPIIDEIVKQVQKDSEKKWFTISRKMLGVNLSKIDGQYYSVDIIVYGDCPDC
jgi:hypothetical protein